MGVLIRSLLVWLLVLAVPAKGLAAASMALCNLRQVPAAELAEMAAHAEQGEHTQHGDPATQANPGNEAAGQPCASAAQDSGHKCSACAACCAAAALPSTLLTVPLAESVPTVFAAVVPSVGPWAVGGQDRPPRPAQA